MVNQTKFITILQEINQELNYYLRLLSKEEIP